VQPSDEDEETRNYRLEIEKQKQLREKIMRDKELKRRRAAEEKLHEVSQFSFIFVGVEQYERFYTILMPLLITLDLARMLCGVCGILYATLLYGLIFLHSQLSVTILCDCVFSGHYGIAFCVHIHIICYNNSSLLVKLVHKQT